MGSHRLFRQASLPAELAKEVVAVIQAHPELGYRTLSEFVRAATVEKLRLAHTHVAMRALWLTADLGAEVVEDLLREADVPDALTTSQEVRRHLFHEPRHTPPPSPGEVSPHTRTHEL